MTGAMTTRHSNNLLSLVGADAQFLRQFLGRELELVVIHKTVSTRVIRRINIDALHLSSVAFHQMVQRIKIIATDIDVFAVRVLWL